MWYNGLRQLRKKLPRPEAEIMQTIFIKFLTEEDRVKGVYALATQASVGGLPGQVYQIARQALTILQNLNIPYREATAEEVKDAHGQVRNPTPSVL
jgi:hypothetical protein